MASQTDLHDLLRLLTSGRNKLPMIGAMARVRALQMANLRSISAIAASDVATLSSAISDEKAAKALWAACRAQCTTSGSKRAGESLAAAAAKRRSRAQNDVGQLNVDGANLEASLALPQPVVDEKVIATITVYSNRAPLLLTFAVQLLKYTMPVLPLSSRLSLGQAVVSLNSRNKAVNLGILQGRAAAVATEDHWARGQPKVKIMGRDISVLKKSGYYSMNSNGEASEHGHDKPDSEKRAAASAGRKGSSSISSSHPEPTMHHGWTVSTPVTSKQSRFIARSIPVSSPFEARSAFEQLFAHNPDLREASHNITAWRVQGNDGGVIVEDCSDDGESGGGRHLLGILRADGMVGVLLVVSRWYGGLMLGPDRWRIMSQVSRDVLSQRLRVAGVIGTEALWALDVDNTMRCADRPVIGDGLPIYRPEGARAYILKAFSSPPSPSLPLPTEDEKKAEKKMGKEKRKESKSAVACDGDKREGNLAFLLGALDLLFGSWVDHLGREELDRRAWHWYAQVRPDVEVGVAGWGGKGVVRLADILALRRMEDG